MDVAYWQAAQPYSDGVLEQSGIGKLQAIHLALQYVLHNPEAGSECLPQLLQSEVKNGIVIWDLTGRASRTVTFGARTSMTPSFREATSASAT